MTALLHVAEKDTIASIVPGNVAYVPADAHYDGVYFYAIARDPLGRGEAHTLIDRASYHYGHPGYGWLTWLASGGGIPGAVPAALLAMTLLGLGVAAGAASVLARDVGMSPWWGLSVAVNPGLLLAVAVDTSETMGVAFALLALLAWSRERWLAAGVLIALGCFMKEPLLFVPAGLLVGEVLRRRAGAEPDAASARSVALATGPVLYFGWVLYCRHVFGVFPSSQISQLSAPISGWLDTLRQADGLVRSTDFQSGMTTQALLLAVGAALALGLVRALRTRTSVALVFVPIAALAFCTNWNVLLYPKDLIRTVALPLALLPFVLGARAGESTQPRG